jgi:hypothetical protein
MISPALPLSLARIVVHADRLHAGMSLSVDDIMKQDVRAHAFMLEGLCRLYRVRAGKHAKRLLEDQLDVIKELEDAIGAYGYAMDMQAVVTNADTTRAVEHSRRALDALRTSWATPTRVQAIVLAFAAAIAEADDDVRHVRKCLRTLLKDIDDDIADLDMDELEDGIHELRRQLRWIPIVMIALNGLVVLNPKGDPIPALAALKKTPLATSRFGQLPASSLETTPIAVPQSLFLELSRTIDVLGKLKDEGQRAEQQHNPTIMAKLHRDAHAIYDALLKMKLVPVLRQQLKQPS